MPTLKGPLAVTLLGLALAACGDSTGPTTEVRPAVAAPAKGGNAGNPQPIGMKSGAPKLAAVHATFWAVQGRETSVAINYKFSQAAPPFLHFTVPSNTQLVDPTGSALAPGDSIEIDIKIVPGQLEARFFPSGLVFANVPAQLAISYQYGDSVTGPLAIWLDDSTWVQQPSTMDQANSLVVGAISHFSNYAVARRSNYAVAY
jgi:hypothetical protein